MCAICRSLKEHQPKQLIPLQGPEDIPDEEYGTYITMLAFIVDLSHTEVWTPPISN